MADTAVPVVDETRLIQSQGDQLVFAILASLLVALTVTRACPICFCCEREEELHYIRTLKERYGRLLRRLGGDHGGGSRRRAFSRGRQRGGSV
jgi:hypothetical protein